jgi:cobalt/nickel transport system permease protein
MADVIHIQIPLWQLPLLAILPPVIVVALLAWLRHLVHERSAPGEEPDWSVPPLDAVKHESPLHRWDVRCKIVTILAYSFMVAALNHIIPALIAVGVSSLVLVVSRASFVKVTMRLLAITGFVGMFLVVMPFTVPTHDGDTVIIVNRLGWLGFNLRGLNLAGTIALKAVAITLLMEPLLSTAPLPVTLQGLSRLGAPEMIGQMVLLSHRYLHVFRHEARRMAAGMQVRGFRKRTNVATLRAVSNFLGMLFVRSFERTERVFDAMRARGYRGRLPESVELRLRPTDLVWAGLWMTAGVILIVCDRLVW